MVLFIMSLNAEGARLYSSISHDDQAFLTRAVLEILLDMLSFFFSIIIPALLQWHT